MRNRLKPILCTIISLMLLVNLSIGFAFAETETSTKKATTSNSISATSSIHDSEIQKVFVGNQANGDVWEECTLNYSGGKWIANLPATYSYVKIQTIRWGMPTTSQYWSMDGQNPVTSKITGYFNSDGIPCSPGSTIYGVSEHTVWAIPQSSLTSQIRINLYSTSGDKQMLCDIVWEGNGGAGPSTASIATADGDTVKLNGVDNTMEYRTTGGAWITCVENQLIPVGETAISVDVRYAATTDSRASDPVTLTMSRRQAPTLTFNESEKIIYGVDNTMEYKVDSGSYVAITDNTLPITDLITPNPTTFYVRYKGANELASLNWSVTVYPIPAAPTTPKYQLSTYYHLIYGITPSMEVSVNEGEYRSYSSDSVNLNNTVSETKETYVDVRYKATETDPASAIKRITIPPVRKPPVDPYVKGAYIYGLQPGVSYELKVSFSSIVKTYYGTVDSTGKCDVHMILATGGSYKIRYTPSGGLGYSPWTIV